ncbi:MAG: glutamine synthetase type III [Clostridiaceae bacterium]|jgi:glutamine synthetase|nr:glutamine synthetase III [Bacillota bacterium]NLN52124.1 glutamine synthetase type III [Clostridiaceae bacterium]
MTRFELVNEFGEKLFGRSVMKDRLPKPVYYAWEKAIFQNQPIDREVADAIAHAMKVWAMERGATHFCHWFQPLTGKTAEKHVSFLQEGKDGLPISRLSGKSLMRGETDGSAFPHGGLRDTFEARGYTYWDVSSSAFVRKNVLYIPSVFISYTGAKLDMKMPLINAREALSKQATRVLNLLGKTEVEFVRPMVGLEQEYFLVYQAKAAQRPDLRFCEKTLFSAEMPRGGDYEDPYFSSMSENIQDFMQEVNRECWALGIYAEIEHNEVAPGQYELVSSFADVTTTIDQNMLIMDILKKVARRHGFECLLTEKPFGGLNGSGKHNNISLQASNGDNLFDPGDRAPEDLQFIVFLSAFIQAVDKYQVLLRMASSNEGNDYRLGRQEAPPSVLSIYLGDKLHDLFMQLAETTEITPVELTQLTAPLVSLAAQSIDATDRNRTAPISFSGNKFEIRTLGASLNASPLNTFLFAGMAESLKEIADRLEKNPRSDADELHKSIMTITHDILNQHHPILFTGNGYGQSWKSEAEKRGLKHYENYIDTVEILRDTATIELLEKFDVLNSQELEARYQVLIKDFIHSVKTQARIITRMAQEGVYPALIRYQADLEKVASGGFSKSATARAQFNADLMDKLDAKTKEIDRMIGEVIEPEDPELVIRGMVEDLRPAMADLATLLREIELYSPYDVFPYPSQEELIVL